MSIRQHAAAQPDNQDDRHSPAASNAGHVETERTHQSMRVQARHVLLLGGITAIGPLSTDMYLPALPAVSQDLGARMAAIQLTLTVGIVGLALGQIVAGPISD